MTFLIGFATLYLALGVFLYFTQRSILYLPDTTRFQPGDAGFPDMDVVSFETADGLTLESWYRKAEPGKLTVLYFHGNAANLLNHSFIARPLLAAGYGVLLLEYRGYGGNPGSPTEDGLYEDARGAIEFLQGRGVGENDIVLFGASLGTGIAVKIATEITPKAVILQSPYTSIAKAGQHHYWYLPVKWLIKDRFASDELISGVKAPLLFLVGTADGVIPPDLSYQLFELAGEPKSLEVFDNVGHNDLSENGGMKAVLVFLDELK